MTVIRLRSPATEYHKSTNTCTYTGSVNQLYSVKQSSRHATNDAIWMCCTLAAHRVLWHMGYEVASLIHCDGMDRWSTFAFFFSTCHAPCWVTSTRNCESGNNKSNCTISEAGCSWFVSSTRLWTIFESMNDARIHKITTWHGRNKHTFHAATPLGGAPSHSPQLLWW